jgi:ATP-binding cassette subfamily B protein
MLYWGHMVGTRMEVEMRLDMFGHLHVLPNKYYDENKTGQIMSRLVGDLREVSELAHHGPEDLFISAVMIVGSFAALVLINSTLTLILFSVLLVLILYTLKKRIKMLATFRTVREAHGGINEQVENSSSGIRVCFAFTNENHEIGQFNVHNERYQKSYKVAYRHMAEYSATTGFLMGLLLVIGLVLGGMYVYQGTMNYGDLASFLLYTAFFVKPIERLVQFTQQYQTGIAGFERFLQIMDVQPAIVDKPGAVQLANPKGSIAFKNATFCCSEGDRCITKGLDIDIKPGTKTTLVGTSGEGKTTIVHMIPRFYDVTGGVIQIDGVDVRDVTRRSLRESIGIVQQDTFIFAGTIKENIKYGKLDVADEQVVAAAKQAQIHDFIASLAGGQKQRIAIARVFLKNPPFVMLDEATSSLDTITEAAIQESLGLLARDRTTTIVVAHRLSTIEHSDEILFIVGTGIAERGTHRQLFAKGGMYARLYKMQQDESPAVAVLEKSAT